MPTTVCRLRRGIFHRFHVYYGGVFVEFPTPQPPIHHLRFISGKSNIHYSFFRQRVYARLPLKNCVGLTAAAVVVETRQETCHPLPPPSDYTTSKRADGVEVNRARCCFLFGISRLLSSLSRRHRHGLKTRLFSKPSPVEGIARTRKGRAFGWLGGPRWNDVIRLTNPVLSGYENRTIPSVSRKTWYRYVFKLNLFFIFKHCLPRLHHRSDRLKFISISFPPKIVILPIRVYVFIPTRSCRKKSKSI